MLRSEVEWRKASKSIQKALSSVSEEVSAAAISIMSGDAYDFLLEVGGSGASGMVPIYTGNLHDSIGVRFLKGNVLVRYVTMTEVTPKLAKRPQSMKGRKNIWGDEELMRVIRRPSRRTKKSVAAQLMVGVPYAESVDQKSGYFEELSSAFSEKITSNLDLLRKNHFIIDV